MDKIIQSVVDLGITGATLVVFAYLLIKLMDSHRNEREKSQARSEAHIEKLVAEFKEESRESREHYEERMLKVVKKTTRAQP